MKIDLEAIDLIRIIFALLKLIKLNLELNTTKTEKLLKVYSSR